MRVSAVVTFLTVLGLFCLSGSRFQDTCAVTIRLIDAATGHDHANDTHTTRTHGGGGVSGNTGEG